MVRSLRGLGGVWGQKGGWDQHPSKGVKSRPLRPEGIVMEKVGPFQVFTRLGVLSSGPFSALFSFQSVCFIHWLLYPAICPSEV